MSSMNRVCRMTGVCRRWHAMLDRAAPRGICHSVTLPGGITFCSTHESEAIVLWQRMWEQYLVRAQQSADERNHMSPFREVTCFFLHASSNLPHDILHDMRLLRYVERRNVDTRGARISFCFRGVCCGGKGRKVTWTDRQHTDDHLPSET